jgi:hypothetical protein
VASVQEKPTEDTEGKDIDGGRARGRGPGGGIQGFGRQDRNRTDDAFSRQRLVILHLHGDPEIDEFDGALQGWIFPEARADEDIFRFHVPVDDAIPVKVGKNVGKVTKQRFSMGEREPWILEVSRQGLTFRQGKDKAKQSADRVLKDPLALDESRMIERRETISFASRTFHGSKGSGLQPEELEGDFSVGGHSVTSTPHFALTTGAEGFEQGVAINLFSNASLVRHGITRNKRIL